MDWKKFTVTTVADSEDAVISMLNALGYESLEIEDSLPVDPSENGGYFGDVVPDLPCDPVSRISFYTEAEADSGKVLLDVREGLARLRTFLEIGEGSVTESSTKEEDWINNWKEHFHKFYVEDILIKPTWEAEEEEDEASEEPKPAMVLRIDPGTAFGTGAHESTQLAIRAIRKYIRQGDRFLDIGTGSGILGIIALKSGASSVFGTDLDENTLPAIADNLARNDIPDSAFTRVLGNIAGDAAVEDKAGYGIYDLAAANIIAEILCDIMPAVPRHMKRGGIYITSGILTEKEQMVIDSAGKAGFSLLEINRQGEWSGIVFQLR